MTTSQFIGREIKARARAAGITQMKIAATTRKAQSYVSYRLNGHEAWTLDDLDRLAPLFGYRDAITLIAGIKKDYEDAEIRRKLREVGYDPDNLTAA